MTIEERRRRRIRDQTIDEVVPTPATAARRKHAAEELFGRAIARRAGKLLRAANPKSVGLADLEKTDLQHAEQAPLESREHMRRQHFERDPWMCKFACECRVRTERRQQHDAQIRHGIEHRREYPGAEHVARRRTV